MWYNVLNSGKTTSREIAGLNEIANPSFFLRNLHTDLHTSCTSVHSHQQQRSFPFFPQLLLHLLLVHFLIISFLLGGKMESLSVIFIWDVKHLLINLFVLCILHLYFYLRCTFLDCVFKFERFNIFEFFICSWKYSFV